ncbi:DUF7550 family protein [Halobellus ordinarius]|uniref:DUF7550 family protein n=1 Tax=Halobellus ordinarius TaxID=3075120 RepID=UPI00288063FA|nr:hypothetical protein [Halobellus sp. ZY16]
MTDDHGHDDSHHDSDAGEERVTSPMQSFGTSQVTTGLVILLVGLVVVFGVPLLV